MIYLLTAIGLSPGGSSTVHIYTQTPGGSSKVHIYTQTPGGSSTVYIYTQTPGGSSTVHIYTQTPGGSSTVHIFTQTIHRTIQNNQYIERYKTNNTQNNTRIGRVRAVPRLG
jgi:hypothetical protein